MRYKIELYKDENYREVVELMRQEKDFNLPTKEYLIKSSYDSAGIKQFISDTDRAKQAATQLGIALSNQARVLDQTVVTSLNKANQSVRTVSTTFEDAGKKSKVAFSTINGELVPATASLKEFGNQSAKADIDLGKLISRAAITIPVWFALRAAVMGVIFGLRDGVKNVVTFDEALQKVKRNLTGTPEAITANFNIMKREITEFSKRTGTSVEEIAGAVKQFATIGFDFQTSLTGGLEATKLATLLFGDASDTANAFASALKILIKTGKDAPPVSQQISEAFALTSELAKDNKDDLGELTQALNKFAATGKTANLSIKETIALLLTLATAGRSGSQSGTLLSTTFNKLLTDLPKVSKQFGIEFDPKTDSGMLTLTKILDKAAELAKAPGGEIGVIEKLGDVFGGERGTKAVSSLLALNDVLKKNLGVTGDVTKFHSDFEKQLDTEYKQAQILTNGIKELEKSFITSLVGANNFKDALKSINVFVKELSPVLDRLAIGVRNSFDLKAILGGPIGQVAAQIITNIEATNRQAQSSFDKLTSGLRGELSRIELDQLLIDVKGGQVKLADNVNKDVVIKALEKALSSEEIKTKVDTEIALKTKLDKDNEALVIRSLENELAELKARLKANGATDIQLQLLDVDFLQSKALQDNEKIRDAQSKIRVATIEKERSITDQLVKAVEDGAKAEGASNLEAIVRRIELEKQLGIERKGMDLLSQQLELQKALTEETKKTRSERLKELETLVKTTTGPFSSTTGESELALGRKEQTLRFQAGAKGISDEQINKILNPESQISGLSSELQNLVTNPMTKGMGELSISLDSLTQTITRQETASLGVGVPRRNIGGAAYNGNALSMTPVQRENMATKAAPIMVEVGDINVTVSGEGTAEEIAQRVGKTVEDMIAAKIVKPGTKANTSVLEVFRKA